METIKSIILNIKHILDDIQDTRRKMAGFLRNNKMGDYQSLSIHLRYQKRKIKGVTKELLSRVQPNLLKVTFRDCTTEEIYEIILANVTQDDVSSIMEMYSFVHTHNYKILEIEEVPTIIRKA